LSKHGTKRTFICFYNFVIIVIEKGTPLPIHASSRVWGRHPVCFGQPAPTNASVITSFVTFESLMLQPRRHAGRWPALLALLLLFAGTVPTLGLDCSILDGRIPDSCRQQPRTNTQQLVTVKVPLDLRVQWGQVRGVW
jgi:hypothetical protein